MHSKAALPVSLAIFVHGVEVLTEVENYLNA